MQSYFSRRDAFLAAIGTFVGTLSLGRSTPARQSDALGSGAIETQPGVGKVDSGGVSDRRATYSFDSKGRLASAVAPVEPSRQWSTMF